MRHRLDPPALHVFAETLGYLHAHGLLLPGEGSKEIAAAVERLPTEIEVDRSGLQARLNWTMRDTSAAISLDRREAERAVRAAVTVAVAGKKSTLIVKAAAEGARGCLPIWEAHAIALDQALQEIQR
jgi:hypothetical protein